MSIIEDLEATFAEEPEPEEFPFAGKAFQIAPVRFDTFLDLQNQVKARLAVPIAIDWHGKPVSQSETLITLALTVQHGVIEPKLTYAQSVKLLMRYPTEGLQLANRITEISGFKEPEQQIQEARAALEADPTAA